MNTEQQSYHATAYHADLGNQMAEGEIVISQWTLHFKSQWTNVDFPLQGLQLHVSDYDAERVLFTHPSQPGWSVYARGLEILEHPVFSQRTELKQQLTKIAERTQNWRKLLYVTVGVCASFLLLALVLFKFTGWTLSFLVTKVPTVYEQKLGDTLFEELNSQIDFVQDKKNLTLLTNIAEQIIPASEKSRFKFRFYIADIEDPNAFALPGGNVIVTTGLLEMLQTREELAGVLAHEVAHVTKRHGLRQIISSVGPYLVLSTFFQGQDGFLALVGDGAQLLITQNFSQKHEMEADEVAWDYMADARLNPHGFIDALEKLRAQNEAHEETQIKALSSHPPTIERIKRLQGKWDKIKDKSVFSK